MSETYKQVRESYNWDDAWENFDGEKKGKFNLGHEVVGKHSEKEDVAVRILDFDTDSVTEMSYKELADEANQFANFLEGLGLEQGDVVAGLLSPQRELYATIVGTWLGGFVYMPFYELFGPEAVNYRLKDSNANIIVTSKKHVGKVDESIDSLEEVVIVDGGDAQTTFEAVATHDTQYEPAETTVKDDAVIQYSSGTTGDPKGVVKGQSLIVAQHPYSKYAVDLRESDNYFGGAPPAWSYGLNMCTARPLHMGIGTTTYRGGFDPESFVVALDKYEITNIFTPPTALRMTANADIDFDDYSFDIRIIATAGESLDSNTVEWGRDIFGVDILDHYGFTEGGMVVVNYPFDDWEVKPGSMGKPTPGFEVELMELDEDKAVEPGDTGEISIRLTDKPVSSKEYLNLPEKTAEMFEKTWMRSGDLARVDDDGYFWYEGRTDDLIISSGYRIGPTEIEDSLMKHEAIEEAAAVGMADQERGEIVAAFIKLADGYEPSPELATEVKESVKSRLSKHEYPREIEFVKTFPRTSSGKIKRSKILEE